MYTYMVPTVCVSLSGVLEILGNLEYIYLLASGMIPDFARSTSFYPYIWITFRPFMLAYIHSFIRSMDVQVTWAPGCSY